MNEDRHQGARRLTVTFVVAAIAVVGAVAWLPAQTPKAKLCCIAGDYAGVNVANALPRCPAPKKETFTMTISQARGCGADVRGTITSASGDVNNFTGTLSPGLRGCCALTASFSDPGHPGHVVTFTGTFCMGLDKKWHAKGTYTETNSGDPCKKGGIWDMTQN